MTVTAAAILTLLIVPIFSAYAKPDTPIDCWGDEYYAESGPACEGCGPRCLAIVYEAKCYCNPGFSRFGGICIADEFCPQEFPPANPDAPGDCGLNEYFGESGPMCEGCGPRCLAIIYETKCYCNPGFSRFHGICIEDEFCPQEFPPYPDAPGDCGLNEYFGESGPMCEGCGPRCLALIYEAKCYCNPGYSRFNGICIPDEFCPQEFPPAPICPEDEEFSDCGSGCTPTCETLNNPDGIACAAVCVEGCFCKEGLIRNKQGICVAPSQCEPVPTCPVNEKYKECGSACAETCETLNKPGGRACAAACVKGCFCEEGLFRNKQGICVPKSQCVSDIKCPANEEPGCEQPCQTCEHKEPCPTFACNPGCVCKPGFYRRNGICILEEFCSVPTCPVNENYTECGSACPETCETINKPGGRACAAVCVKGCFCKEGFVRNKKGICVPKSQCVSVPTCPVNEEYNECGTACPDTCETINKPGERACIALCVEGCFCKKGLVRNKQGLCVPPSQCVSAPVCPANEEFLECGSGCAPTCDDIGRPPSRGCAAVCVKGCFCKNGFVRNKQNVCVPPSQCRPDIICSPNETPGCEQPSECQTCEHKELCPTFVCNHGCICKPGFYRRHGICIPEQFCSNRPIPCPLNEVPGCEQPPGCLTCENKLFCPTFVCNPGCLCRPGFYRRNGICVHELFCSIWPPQPQC